MKKILIATIILCFSLSPIHAEDYETTHTFGAGDIISAEMMNEIFNKIQFANAPVSSDTILGRWECTATQKYGSNHLGTKPAGLTSDNDNLYEYRSDNVTFVDDGDGTYSYTTSPYNIIKSNDPASTGFGKFNIQNNVLYLEYSAGGSAGDGEVWAKMQKVSSTSIIFDHQLHGTNNAIFYECDKQATPPTNPTAFASATTGLSNGLTWTDNSSDETGFKVYKKTSATGSWVLIDAGAGLTVNSNIVTYTDTVSAAGDNWYRVKANNVNNGDSVGSKVIMTEN
jgi:hypothetical protein